MFQNYEQYMFIFYKHRKFLLLLYNYKQIYEDYMCVIMLIKMKFFEATSEKKIIRCFRIKYLNFNQYFFLA